MFMFYIYYSVNSKICKYYNEYIYNMHLLCLLEDIDLV